jgi:hypothetical protein
MKLTDLFWRDRKRADRSDNIPGPVRRGNDGADRSSMADLVRLLREADDAQKNVGHRSA